MTRLGLSFREIIEKIDEWLRTPKKEQPYVDPNLDPVLLVPGIAGSILTSVDEKGGKERVWVRILACNREFQRRLWSIFNPTTGKTESLDPSSRIEVPDDRYGLYSLDVLDPDLMLGTESVYYFHNMIEKMISWGYKEGTTLFGFGYDFRQSNRLKETMEKLKEKLETIHQCSGGKKVNIISHSMGGVLIKCFMALHAEVFEKYVNNWITIGTPFQGAPGYITDALLDGVAFLDGWEQNLFVSKWSMHQLLVECPSIYELMANPNFKWSSPPLLQIWQDKKDETGKSSIELETYGPQNCVTAIKKALVNNIVNYNGNTIPLPFNCEIFKWSNETRRILSSAKLPASVKFFNIYGTENDTPFSVCYGSKEAPVAQLEKIWHSEAAFTYADGDGTVPRESAMGDSLNAEERIGVPGEHRGLLCDEHVFHVLKCWLKIGDPDPFYDPVTDYVILPTKAEFEELMEKWRCRISESWEIIQDSNNDESEVVICSYDYAEPKTTQFIDSKAISSLLLENYIGDSSPMSENIVDTKPSPYLLQHTISKVSMEAAHANQNIEGYQGTVVGVCAS